MTETRIVLSLSVLAAVLLAGCGLSSEPEIAQEIPSPTSAPTITAPETMPDLVHGAVFYAAHCVTCHGEGGRGDGEMVRSGRLQDQPPDFTDSARTREKTPQDYMVSVTEGNALAGMPSFGGSIQDRWDVTAYVFTAALTADRLALGAQVYTAQCAVCHGPEGRGDGPEAVEIMPDLADPTFWAGRSDADLFRTVSEGFPPKMPDQADRLTEDERWAVVGFVRALAVTGTPGFPGGGAEQVAAPEATAEATAIAQTPTTGSEATGEVPTATPEEPEFITVVGQVTNGTAGGRIPEGATITLHMFDPPDYIETTLQTTLNADGSYTFADVPHLPQRTYLLSMQVDDVFFRSDAYNLEDPASATLDTAIEIFEMTNDSSVVRVTAGVMRIAFTSFGMEVVEAFNVENTSDRLLLTDETLSGNRRVALRIPLPPGAGGVAFEPGTQGTRFFVSADGTAVIDTQPLRPGTDEIYISYFIPYEDGAIIEQVFPYAVSGPFHLLVEANQVTLESETFVGSGEQVDMGGQTFEAYVAELDLPPGEAFSYTITGIPAAVAAGQDESSNGEGQLSPLVLVLVVVGLLLIGAGGFMILLRQGGVDPTQRAIDGLLDQIAALDNQNERGELNHDYYGRRRAELKAQLAELMRQQQAGAAGQGKRRNGGPPDGTAKGGEA